MRDVWEADAKIVQKVLHRLTLSEKQNRHLRKRSEEYQVLEEVFDRPTLLTLYDLMNEGVFAYLNGVVKAGKEARVYWGVKENGEDVAVKIYLVIAAEFRKRMQYVAGDRRFKNVKRGGWSLITLWARKEFRNLTEASAANVPVPKPIAVRKNVLVTEFMGTEGVPFPLLGENAVEASDYRKLISLIRTLYRRARLVHSDLSEYNVFKSGRKLTIFDFGSAVEVGHPLSKNFLQRDIININRFFSKKGLQVRPTDKVLDQVIGSEL